jgi:hypothetical protein
MYEREANVLGSLICSIGLLGGPIYFVEHLRKDEEHDETETDNECPWNVLCQMKHD